MLDVLILLLGIACAGFGGELFVRGLVGLAAWVRISPGIIGATVAAFATSSPELSVAINSALAQKPEISLGDALGSNVVNIALILGVVLVISGIQCQRDSIRRDFPVALLVPVLTAVLILDGVLSRIDGVIMLLSFAAWLLAAIVEARKQRSAAQNVIGAHRPERILLFCVSGFILLVLAGYWIVLGAKGIALRLGIGEFIIGATLVAVGTSAPELATAVMAKLRGHDEVGLGTLLGSNIFNGLFIIAVAAVIFPINVGWREVLITLVFGLLAVIFTFPTRGGFIERRRGVLLLGLYGIYMAAILQSPASA